MEEGLTVLVYLTTLLDYFSAYFILFGRRTQKPSKKRGIILFVAAAALLVGIFQKWNTGMSLLWIVAWSICCMNCLFQVTVREGTRIGILAFWLLSITNAVLENILIQFLQWDIIYILLVYQAGIAVIMWIVFWWVGRKMEKDAFILNSGLWWMLTLFLMVLVLLITYFIYVLQYVPADKGRGMGAVLIAIGGFVICVLVFCIIYYFNVMQKYIIRNENLETYNRQQKMYFEGMLKKEQDTRKFRHDIINEILELKFYSENGQYEKLGQYLSQMNEQLQIISENQFDVGNDAANTIINYYLVPLKETCQIKVRGLMEAEGSISDRDICVLFSNLICNAVESLEKLPENKRWMSLVVDQGEQFLTVDIENAKAAAAVTMKNGIPVTTKKDFHNHGLGLQNVMSVVQKYEGIYEQEIKEESYRGIVRLKI